MTTGSSTSPLRFLAAAVLLLTLLPGDVFAKPKKTLRKAPVKDEATDKPIPRAVPVMEDEGADVRILTGADGSTTYELATVNPFDDASSPDISGKSLYVVLDYEYDPVVDRESTVIGQGDLVLGWCVHLVDGKPAFTINYEGLHTTLKGEEELPAGHVHMAAVLGLDGSLALQATGLTKEVRGFAPMEDGFPRKPEKSLTVGKNAGVLNPRNFPKSTPFHGSIFRVMLRLLPVIPSTLESGTDPKN